MRHGKRTLVTGGCGFLGSHVIDTLVADDVSVTVFDRNLCPAFAQRSGVTYICGNMSDYPLVERIVSDDFDVIMHLASSTTPRSSNANPVFDVASNAAATVHLIECAARTSVAKFVFLSSGGAIYGDVGEARLITEDQEPRPISSYGITKLTIEHYLRMYNQLHGFQYAALRVSNPFGSRQNPNSGLGAVTTFLDRAMRGVPLEIWGDGSVVRDFVFVSDVARAITLAAFNDVSGVFNVGSGTGHSLNQIISHVGSLVGVSPTVHYHHPRLFDPRCVVLDCSRIERSMGWKSRVGLLDGMVETLDWLRESAEAEVAPSRVVNL